jgi:photosystem II stability/assembly factor-like uncharacterized protein
MDDVYSAGDSALWVQPDGPNTKPEFLGCHQMGALTVPLGELAIRYQPDPAVYGKFIATEAYQESPGAITSTITTYLGPTADWLGKMARRDCWFPVYVFKGTCGRRDVFYAWERGFGLHPAKITQRSFDKLTSREPSDEGISEQTFNISAMKFYEWFDLAAVSQPIAELQPLLSVWTCSVPQCADDCGDSVSTNQYMLVGARQTGAAHGVVWYTLNQGEDWIVGAVSPWAAAYDILSVVCFPLDDTTTRWLVASDDADLSLEVAYSDDQGTTWTAVVVATTMNQLQALGARALFCLDAQHIWFVTAWGHILFSSDGGEHWMIQLNAGPILFTTVYFSDAENGMAVAHSDHIYVTKDGGVIWTEVTATGTGEALVSVVENAGGGTWWVGTRVGKLFYSDDHGDTWTRRTGFAGEGSGEVKSIRFADELTGFMAHNSKYWGDITTGRANLLQTVDGGYSWKVLATPDNLGFTDITVDDANAAFAVGVTAVGWDALVLKIHE